MSQQTFKTFVQACREAIAREEQEFIAFSFHLAKADTIIKFVPRRMDITRENAAVEFTPDLETAIKRFLRKEQKEGFVYDVEPLGDDVLMTALMAKWQRYFMRYVQMTLTVHEPDAVWYEPTEEENERRQELRGQMLAQGWQFQGHPIINKEEE